MILYSVLVLTFILVCNKTTVIEDDMANSNKKRSSGLISNAFSVAKKLSETGLSVMNHVAPGTVSKLTQSPQQDSIVQGSAKEKHDLERKKYENPQQMMREHLPTVTGKLFGKHYNKVNNVASFVSPDLNDKLSDLIFNKLNDFVSELTSVEALLKEVGAKNLEELAKDPQRSQRISTALANQNKLIAVVQGAMSGAVGGVGAIIDVPTSLALALRSIYHTGRAYGFELNIKDQAIVEYIFKEIDLGTVAEKQALLATLRTFVGILQTHNVSQLQQLLGSGNDIDVLKRFIANDDGSFKLTWLNNLPHFALLSRLTPLATMGISAVYSWKLVDDATDKAQIVFAGARQYLLAHPDENIDALEAYEKSTQSISETTPLLLKEIETESKSDAKRTDVVEDKPQITKPIEEMAHQAESKVQSKTSEKAEKAEKESAQTAKNSSENNVQSKATPKAKTTTTRARRTTQKVEPNAEGADKTVSVTKTSTSAKTVTKKRVPTKAKENLENTVKTSEKSLENTENKTN